MEPVLRNDMKLADTPSENTRRLKRPRSSIGAGGAQFPGDERGYERDYRRAREQN